MIQCLSHNILMTSSVQNVATEYVKSLTSKYILQRRFLQCNTPNDSVFFSWLVVLPFNPTSTHLLHFFPLFPFVYPLTLFLNRSHLGRVSSTPSSLRRLTVITREQETNLPRIEPYITTSHFMGLIWAARNIEVHAHFSKERSLMKYMRVSVWTDW